MSSIWSSIWGSSEDNHKKSSQTQSEINQSVMQSMESSNPNNQQSLKQSQPPSQIVSQSSSSSSGFQQINIQEQQKQPKLTESQLVMKKLNIQQSNEKFDSREFNMDNTMDFNEDLNRSITDYPNKIQKSSLAEKYRLSQDEQQKTNQSCSINQTKKQTNEESFSDITSSQKYNNEQSFSDITTSRQENQENQVQINSLKKLQKIDENKSEGGSDQAEEMKSSDEQQNGEQTVKDSKNKKKDKNIASYLSVWGISQQITNLVQKQEEKQTNVIPQRKYSGGFSLMDFDPLENIEYYQGKKQQVQELEEIFLQKSLVAQKNQSIEDIYILQKSIVAPKIQSIQKPIIRVGKNNDFPKEAFKKSPTKLEQVLSPNKSKGEQACIPRIINMQQSFIMEPVVDRIRCQKKQVYEAQIRVSNQIPFIISPRDTDYFIKYGKTQDRKICDKLIQSITESFLIQNIMLPIFNMKLIEDLSSQEINYENRQMHRVLFEQSINLYFEFLHKKYPNKIRIFFQKQQSMKNSKSQINIQSKKDQSSALFSQFYKIVFDYLKLNHYSKAQILKKTLQTQLQFMKQYKNNWLQNQQQQGFDHLEHGQKIILSQQKQKQILSKQKQILSKQKQKLKLQPQKVKSSEQNHHQLSKQRYIQQKSAQQQKIKQKRINIELKQLKQKQLNLLKKISELQILISFEKSQIYCEQKLKQKLQENIWKQRKKKLIHDRNWFITNLFYHCFI